MNKLIEAATVIAASLFLLIVIGISVSVAILFLGWIWLGVESVWGMIF